MYTVNAIAASTAAVALLAAVVSLTVFSGGVMPGAAVVRGGHAVHHFGTV